MSGSAANLPVAVTLQGADTTEAALRRIADRVQETFVANSQLAQQTPVALGRVSEAFGALEQRTQRARGAVNDLKGSMELLGAGNVAGVLGGVGGTVGNLADAFGTAVRFAESFGGTLATLGRFALPAGAALAAIALATTDWGEATDKVRRGLQDLRGVSYDANTATEAYGRGITSLIGLLETAADRERRLAAETRQRIINTMMGEEQTVRGQLGPARARLAELQPTADQVALARQVAGPDTVLPANIQRRMAEYDRVLADVRRMEAQAAALEGGMRDLSQIPYGAPASIPGAPPEAYGPPVPPRGGAGGGRGGSGRDPISDMVDRAVERAREQQARDEERARQQRERDEERALERMQRANERTTDAIVSYSADRFADLWNGTGDGFQKLMDSLYRTAINTFARIASEAIIRPIVAPIVSELGLGGLAQAGAGGGGGLGDVLGLGGSLSSLTGGGIGEMLGLSGGVGGLLSTPLWTSSSGAMATAPLAAGVAGPVLPASALGSMGMGVTAGGLLMGAGLGFGAGMLTSSFTANSAARRTNGQIGSALGTAAGFALTPFLGPLGPIAGGALGGALGGLIGPGKGASGGDVQIQIDGAGRLVAGRAAGKNFDTGPLSQQARQQVAALNQQLAAAGLRLPGNGDLGWIGGGGSTNPGDVATLLARSGVGVRADDPRIQGVLDRRGVSDINGALGVAQEVGGFIAQLSALRVAATDVTDPLKRIEMQFAGLFDAARQYGFGLDEVQAAQDRAIKALKDQAAGQASGVIGGLADYARGLRTANDNAGNPITRFAAAEGQFGDVAARALGGDFNALSRLQSSAETFRGLARQIYGTGGGFAAAEDRIASVLDQVGAIGEDRLTASVLDASVQRQTDTLGSLLIDLRAEVTALRRDVQQGQANPLAGRTA